MREEVNFRDDVFEMTDSGIRLVGARCKKCGHTMFPQSDFCQKCLSEDVEKVYLSDTGVLHTYTITRVRVDKFPLPHAIGMIDLPERVRVTAPLVLQDEDYEIGSQMKLTRAVLWNEEDHDVIGYKFQTVRGADK